MILFPCTGIQVVLVVCRMKAVSRRLLSPVCCGKGSKYWRSEIEKFALDKSKAFVAVAKPLPSVFKKPQSCKQIKFLS